MAADQQKRLRLEFKISGMSCAHCERKVEAAAMTLDGVESAKADARKGILNLVLGTPSTGGGKGQKAGTEPDVIRDKLAAALESDGYAVISEAGGAGIRRDSMVALAIGLPIAGGFALADALGVFAIIPTIDAGIGIGALFVTGLLTSLHCVSMCGGIALSQGVKGVVPDGAVRMAAAGKNRGFGDALAPSLAYNLGRITSYTIIGALAGAAGAAMNIGLMGKAVLMGLAGVFMMGMGLSLAGWLRLPQFSWPAYDRFRSRVGIKASRLGPFAVGLANGLMPCGPLQAMQVYALGSGSAGAGALAMLAFSSGTAPLLFAFGAGGALVPIRYRAMAIKAGAVLVAFLGIMTLGRAWALTGMTAPWNGPQVRYQASNARSETAPALKVSGKPQQTSGVAATLVDGIQVAEINVGPRSYGEIVVQAGIPVRFNLKVAPGMLNGCNNAIIIPALGIQKPLAVGDNFVDFIPGAAGVIPYSCWMGMIRSKITVVEPSAGSGLSGGAAYKAGLDESIEPAKVKSGITGANAAGGDVLAGFFQAIPVGQASDDCCVPLD